MKRSYIFLAPGFEEIEALGTADILRRAGMDIVIVSVNDDITVAGAHGICAVADCMISECDFEHADWLICPGGLPGATNLAECPTLSNALVKHHNEGKHIAAICASPAVVLAPLGILNGKNATAYPGFEEALVNNGATALPNRAVVADNVVTSNGPSSYSHFALAIISETLGNDKANEVAAGLLID